MQVTASSLLGLTLHCARCHDHKFEPITQREYYQFQAIFFPAFNPQDWVNPQDRVVYAHLPGEREQWSAAQADPDDVDLVRIAAYGDRLVLHPGRQVQNYVDYMADFVRVFDGHRDRIGGAAYLHLSLIHI